MTDTRPAAIPQLTGLRLFAALAVVLYHFRDHFTALIPPLAVLDRLFASGDMGVDLFFALSGFVLTYNYRSWFWTWSPRAYARFLLLRIARIYPVHLFTLAVVGSALVVAAVLERPLRHPEHYALSELFANVALVHAWRWELVTSWNAPSWSISAEWFAYLLFPLATALTFRRSWAGLGLAAALAPAALLLLMAAGLDWERFALLRVAAEFTMGCALASLFLVDPSRTPQWSAIGIGLIAIAGALALGGEHPHRSLLIPILGLLVYAVARSRGPLYGLLAMPAIVFGGEISYSIYMTHGIVDTLVSNVLPPARAAALHPFARGLLAVAYVIAIGAAAAATYALVERPVRSRIRERLGMEPGPAGRRTGGVSLRQA